MISNSPHSAESGASVLTLRRNTTASFRADLTDLDAFIEWACDVHQYEQYPARSPAEYARLWNEQRSLLVVYGTGTILIQGQHQQEAFERLDLIAVGVIDR